MNIICKIFGHKWINQTSTCMSHYPTIERWCSRCKTVALFLIRNKKLIRIRK